MQFADTVKLKTLHLVKTWIDPLMGQTQQASKLIRSRPMDQVETDVSACISLHHQQWL